MIVPPYTIQRFEPKTAHIPLGLAYIAAVVEKDYSVKILDAQLEGFYNEVKIDEDSFRYGLSFEDIERQIKSINPDVVGVSCLFDTLSQNAHKVCDITKSIDKTIITVMGGAHPSVAPEFTLKNQNVDYVLIGEADKSFPELLKAVTNGEIDKIDGIAFRILNNIQINPKTSFIKDLDSLPLPAWHLLKMQEYFKINQSTGSLSKLSPNMPIVTSRGCPARCIFCSIHTVWGRSFRYRSPENILNEIQYLIDTYGIKELQFEDDNLIFNKKRALEIFDGMIKRNFNIIWETPNGTAAWALDDELLEKMKKSGCYRIVLAIESGDQDVLKNIIKKPLNLDTVKPLVKKAKKIGLEVHGFFVVGFPGETLKQIKKTFTYARGLNLDLVYVFFATPRAGTELFKICQEKGYINKEIDFASTNVSASSIETDNFTKQELEHMFALHMLLININGLFHNPIKYSKYIIRKLKKNPVYFFNIIHKMIIKKIFN
ncbi:MAG: cobalamin-dependent protein [Nitrospirae bacterium]|nr:cobalamin-dependent protein [Nitrospirota bacterium]